MIASLRANLRREPELRPLASWWGLVFGALHSVLMAISLPMGERWSGLWILSAAAVAPLILAAEARWARPRRSVLAVYAGCTLFWLYEELWTWDISVAGYFPLCLYLAIYPAVFFAVLRRARDRRPKLPLGLVAAVLWTGLEVLRGEVVWHGYAWGLVAHPLIVSPWLSSPAVVLGTYFVSFLIVMITGAGVGLGLARLRGEDGDRRRTVRQELATLAFAAAVFVGCGLIPDAQPEGERITVGVVQTNVAQSNKMAGSVQTELDTWDALAFNTLELARQGAEFVVWPETMKPGLTLDPASVETERRAGLSYQIPDEHGQLRSLPSTVFADQVLELQKQAGVPIVVGEDAFDGLRFENDAAGIDIRYDHRYNSVFIVDGGGVSPTRYDKVHLTPFGEEMPYIGAFPWLKDRLLALAAQQMKLDQTRGRGPVTLEVVTRKGRTVRLATPICFEVTDGRLCRRMAAGPGGRRAELLVNLTNDGWFGGSDRTRAQHLQIARWRARELGTPVVRSANTGISAVIDARGMLVPRAGEAGAAVARARQEGRLIREVAPARGLTIYARVGDVFTWAVLAAALVLISAAFFTRPGVRSAARV